MDDDLEHINTQIRIENAKEKHRKEKDAKERKEAKIERSTSKLQEDELAKQKAADKANADGWDNMGEFLD